MSFNKVLDCSSSDDEDDVDYIPQESFSDNEEKTEDTKYIDPKTVKKNKEEAKKIWLEMKDENKCDMTTTTDKCNQKKEQSKSSNSINHQINESPKTSDAKKQESSKCKHLNTSLKLDSILNSSKRKSSDQLANILSSVSKKSKMSTLEKSRLDWKQFKKDEDIEEDLSSFSRSKDGYVEKLLFLERTDQRQYQIEKNIRLKKSNKR